MQRKLFIIVFLAVLTESMIRPISSRNYEGCECETSVKPCEEEPTPPGNEEETTSIPPITSPSTTQSTTSLPSTTSPYICNVQGYQFRVKRKNGFWWCMFASVPVYRPGEMSLSYSNAQLACASDDGWPAIITSIESDEELDVMYALIDSVTAPHLLVRPITGFWVNVTQYPNQTYYWSDGSASEQMVPQPEVIAPGGKALYTFDPVARGRGIVRIMEPTFASKNVSIPIPNVTVCGFQGIRYN
ncbi:C-type lectin domain-containing protein [Caenorhabditis elegans]|uniref:C-type lectin domain-containing protein n=1 Tax=Caenorhabditis elegans TaxID=6239 RepID=Q960A6_CAEEL|nr:C-type lectin domain-containing protein [Caenorhabditis elegans]CCD69840.1 C-type lectin domain-containing protein [Caenorhabditis elegans]|eukprot:NP_505148.1 C-type LECtin [Caenorhabditis elegans]